jgi:hypothetical protein
LVTCNIKYQQQHKLQYINYSHDDSNLLKWCHCVYIHTYIYIYNVTLLIYLLFVLMQVTGTSHEL